MARKDLTNYIFFAVTLAAAIATLCFGAYQYKRERIFRCEILHANLQLNNYRYFEGRANNAIRITIIDTLGNVLFDSELNNVATMGNHLHRVEVQAALANGDGYDVKRASETNSETYFYSATLINGKIVRSAVPYNTPLTASLKTDSFFYYTTGVFALIIVVLMLRHRLNKSESEKQRIKRQLTQNAAHELKTPVASISGYLETLLTNPNIDREKQHYFLQRCYAQSQRMSHLLNDMSTLTQLDNPSASRATEDVDCATILHQMAEDTKPMFDERGIRLLLALPEHINIKGDAQQIYSLFRNIFDNTLAYANGADFFKIKASLGAHNVQFSFSDNGVGVEPQHLPHLFERFYRVDKGRSRKMGGTGLGLAIVKNIALQYKGTATATETPGGGLTIEITLQR